MKNALIEAYRNKSITFKLLINYITIILTVVLILSFINTRKVTKFMQNTLNKNAVEIILEKKNNVEFKIKEMEDIVFYIKETDVVRKYLSKEYKSCEEDKITDIIKENLKTYTSRHQDITGILIVDDRGVLISNDMLQITSNSLKNEKWYKEAVQEPDSIHIFNKPIGRNVRNIFNCYPSDNIISIAKAIKYNGDNYSKGVVLIDLKLNYIGEIISDEVFENKGFFYITDSNNEIVYTPVNKVVYRINPKWINGTTNNVVKYINGEKYQMIYEYSPYTDCNFVGVFSLNETLKVIHDMKKETIFIGLVILVFAIIAAYLYTGIITKPLNKLQVLMNKAESGQLDVKFNVRYNDEIGRLGTSFNKMIESIKNLINIVVLEQQRKREAELKAFQAQIKPHFLYNTLDTINWMAQEYEADEICEVVTALTNLFRISLSKGKEIITLEDELKHVENYLTIQSIRYEDEFTYDIQYDNSLLKKRVMKLILQPIVENSLYHGIKEKEEIGHISIVVKELNNKICFLVKDDGVGIEEDKLHQIMKSLNERGKNTKSQGIGIFNVNERLKLSFGQDYGIKVYSKLGKGTLVLILHPIL